MNNLWFGEDEIVSQSADGAFYVINDWLPFSAELHRNRVEAGPVPPASILRLEAFSNGPDEDENGDEDEQCPPHDYDRVDGLYQCTRCGTPL